MLYSGFFWERTVRGSEDELAPHLFRIHLVPSVQLLTEYLEAR